VKLFLVMGICEYFLVCHKCLCCVMITCSYFYRAPLRQITFKRGVVRVTWLTLNFQAPSDVSEMAKARVVKFCTQVDYVIA